MAVIEKHTYDWYAETESVELQVASAIDYEVITIPKDYKGFQEKRELNQEVDLNDKEGAKVINQVLPPSFLMQDLKPLNLDTDCEIHTQYVKDGRVK
jgi:hypothetical protein